MIQNFKEATLGKTGLKVFRLGLSASYLPGEKTIRRSIELGINYFFAYGFDRQMTKSLPKLIQSNREKFVLATGAYNYIWGFQNLEKALEKRLRQFKTDYIDLFMFLGVLKPKEFNEQTRDALRKLRETGKVKAIGMSCHDRKFAGELAKNDELDALMIRYNAAHRGAEEDIFPHLTHHTPGIISYTATRWSYLLRRPRTWSKTEPLPTAPMCYRFVLSNPNVDVCMTAPSNIKQLEENVRALELGVLNSDEMNFMKRFGDVVHNQKKWFM